MRVEADEFIRRIEDERSRIGCKSLLDGLVGYYEQDPSRLQSSFDLLFIAQVLAETIDLILRQLDGRQPIEYWFPDYPQSSPVNISQDVGSTGLRFGQAFNYAADCQDQRIQATLLVLMTRANLKQSLLMPGVRLGNSHGLTPPIPAAPQQSFDYLFMVIAVEHSLKLLGWMFERPSEEETIGD